MANRRELERELEEAEKEFSVVKRKYFRLQTKINSLHKQLEELPCDVPSPKRRRNSPGTAPTPTPISTATPSTPSPASSGVVAVGGIAGSSVAPTTITNVSRSYEVTDSESLVDFDDTLFDPQSQT